MKAQETKRTICCNACSVTDEMNQNPVGQGAEGEEAEESALERAVELGLGLGHHAEQKLEVPPEQRHRRHHGHGEAVDVVHAPVEADEGLRVDRGDELLLRVGQQRRALSRGGEPVHYHVHKPVLPCASAADSSSSKVTFVVSPVVMPMRALCP